MSGRRRSGRHAAIVFDLFGTLITFEPSRLPTLCVDGVRVPSTIPVLGARLGEYAPGVTVEDFARALRSVSEDLRREHGESLVEAPSRERFRRALQRVACPDDRVAEAAVVLSRAHHEGIARATLFPEAHRAVFEAAVRRGPVGLVSNFDDTTSAFAILARHGLLDSLATVVISEAVGLRKPHPALLRTALDAMRLAPGDVVFVGDSFPADVGVAHAVGADAAWIDAAGDGVPAGAAAPRYVLRRLEDLFARLGESETAG